MTFNPYLAWQCAEKIRALYAGELAPNVVARSTDTQARVEVMADGRFLIVFPGTASAQDWLTDLQIRRVPWDGCRPDGAADMKVHRGFAAALESVMITIGTLLPDHGRANVVITGHSLGGALATLCAYALHGLAHVTDVITFGSPRVGNAAFVGEYNLELGARTARIVNAHDPVPHVPWLLGLYRHVETQVYLDPEGEVRIDEPLRVAAAEWTQTLSQMGQPRAAIAELRYVSEHHIQSYLSKLKSISHA